METSWRRPKFLRRPKRTLKQTTHIALNLFFALALVVLSYAPLVANVPGVGKSLAPQIASADELEWGDIRPPLTDDEDQTSDDGFDALPRFGNVPHAITVAPNGDIFVGGNAGDIDMDGDGACDDDDEFGVDGDDADVDYDGDDACDLEEPVVYRSQDGGLKWRAAEVGTAAAQGGALIRDIAVSPEYPTDDFIIVVFSDQEAVIGGDSSDNTNGVAISTNGGLTFAVSFTGDDADDGDLDEVAWLTVALSADFDSSEDSGTIAIGGAFVESDAAGEESSVYRASAGAFNDDDEAEGTWVGMIATGGEETVDDVSTLSLRFAYDEEPIALGRVVADLDDGETYGEVTTSADWEDLDPSELMDDFAATHGQFGFDEDYELNGIVYGAASNAVGDDGGVYKFTGTWTNESADDDDCALGFTNLSVTGNGSSATILASANQSVIVCRSTNAGSTWSDVDADGGDSVADDATIGAGVTSIGRHPANAARAYWATDGTLGGVLWSSNTGSGWQDSGLTNDAYVVTTVTEASATIAFAGGTDAVTDNQAIFKTTNYGTGAAWYRVDRTPDGNNEVILAPDFLTSGVAYRRRPDTGEERLLVSTNMGERFDAVATDPVDDEEITTATARSATALYVGTEDGNVFMTNDRGASWTQVPFNETDDRIDEFDFASDSDLFVSALDDDNTLKIWHTTDSGATWTLVGEQSPPWGTGDGGITTVLGSYSATTGAGVVLAMLNGAVSIDDVYRINIGTTSAWEDLDMGGDDINTWTSMLITTVTGQGDGRLLTLWRDEDVGAPILRQTYFPITGESENFDDEDDEDDLLLNLPNPDETDGTMGTARTLPGYTLQTVDAGRIMEFTLNNECLGGITLTDPPMNGSVTTNTTADGTPTVFRWTDVEGADEYDLLIGLTPNLTDGDFVEPGGDPVENNVATVDEGDFALVPGETYYWAVRVAAADDGETECNWSQIGKFSVTPPSGSVSRAPELLLPSEGESMPNLGPILLSWNNPPGTTQYHIEVRPLGDDGPGINLIISDPAMVASASYTIQPPMFGSGNYVMLPGATYRYRVRTSGSTASIGVEDASWGPWSALRTFKTPRANAGTIQLVRPINGQVVTDRTPTVEWKDSNAQMFYYEVQLSSDADFGAGPRGPIAAVQHQLVHAGETNPPMSYTSPVTLEAGTFYWRVRQRTQATQLGPEEPGIAWSPTQSFMVQ